MFGLCYCGLFFFFPEWGVSRGNTRFYFRRREKKDKFISEKWKCHSFILFFHSSKYINPLCAIAAKACVFFFTEWGVSPGKLSFIYYKSFFSFYILSNKRGSFFVRQKLQKLFYLLLLCQKRMKLRLDPIKRGFRFSFSFSIGQEARKKSDLFRFWSQLDVTHLETSDGSERRGAVSSLHF